MVDISLLNVLRISDCTLPSQRSITKDVSSRRRALCVCVDTLPCATGETVAVRQHSNCDELQTAAGLAAQHRTRKVVAVSGIRFSGSVLRQFQ